ncbi:MAG: cytochrome c biogenesis protein CcsA [Planctomycetota bacterium]
MATGQIPSQTLGDMSLDRSGATAARGFLTTLAQPLASLKLTVALLAASIFIVFVGTLAQVDQDMWAVMDDYFDSWVAKVPLQVFFPRSWFPSYQNIPGWFPFFGGKTIGCLMMLNLVAAHALRFQARARGQRLFWGLVTLAVGIFITTLVVISGQSRGGLQGKPPLEWTTLWNLVRFSLVLAAGGCIYGLKKLELSRRSERLLLWSTLALLLFTLVVLFWPGANLYLGDAGMRILWQLMQGTFAGCVLLAGCYLIFEKRAGVVLLHSGIGLLMVGQLLVSLFAVEERMSIREGEATNYVQDIRGVEIAVLETSTTDRDQVVAIPITEKGKETAYAPVAAQTMLGQEKTQPARKVTSAESGLPFDIEVVKFLKNSSGLRDVKPDEENLATKGVGLSLAVDEMRGSSGASSDSRVDVGAAYVRLTDAESGQDLGTYLLSQVLTEQNHVEKLTVGERSFELALRFKRQYKPYTIALKDVRKDDYPGTSIPKNYSSDIRLSDPNREFDDEIHIRMNEPLRYAGETFYQSGYRMDRDGTEVTDLQVVTNTGWMIPYVACALVGVAMTFHFLQVLLRFINRLSPTSTSAPLPTSPTRLNLSASLLTPARLVVPALTGLFLLVLYGYAARTPKLADDGFDLYAFGQLPVLEKGRVKPLDTLARNTLRSVANRETFKDQKGKTQPAIRWFLDFVTDREDPRGLEKDGRPLVLADEYEVFRIENDDVMNLLGLERRPSLRFSVNELSKKIQEFEKQVESARQRGEKKAETLSPYERKLIELDQRVRAYTLVKFAFSPVALPPFPTEQEFAQDPERAKQLQDAIRRRMMTIPDRDKELARMQPPLAVPPLNAGGKENEEQAKDWLPYSTAANRATLERMLLKRDPTNAATASLEKIFAAYARNNQPEFNAAVREYRNQLKRERPIEYSAAKVSAESWMNQFAPFFYSTYVYVLALVVTALAWLFWIFGKQRLFNQTAFWMILITFVVHTLALALRVYISGRPPVTNLYSSAIFIGWACVVFGLVIEVIFKLGIGNAIASVSGFSTLLIADKLAMDGDTMAVMQAVLDTQFWLSTHVICITLGYAATFVAGLLGVVYILAAVFTNVLDRKLSDVMGDGGAEGSTAAAKAAAMKTTARSARSKTPATTTPAALLAQAQAGKLKTADIIALASAAPTTAHSAGMQANTIGKSLTTMTYGVMCFAILFSFIGTVLGGLWADDSWGRFWGWDPKENGALIIVLWNALVLHVRWDRMVGDRGFAMLSVVGNVVTAWSWFGVNELGVGLHSYGFTEGVLRNLGLFVLSQLLIVIVGLSPLVFSTARGRRADDLG